MFCFEEWKSPFVFFFSIFIVVKTPPEVFCKKGGLKNFAKIHTKHLYQSVFFNKNAGLRPGILLKKRLWYRCFPMSFAKLLRKVFLQNTSGGLLL